MLKTLKYCVSSIFLKKEGDNGIQKHFFNVEEGIATITFNRPKALNAMNSETMTELLDAATICKKDENIKALILTGSGDKAFVAGADISQMQNNAPLEAFKFMEFGHDTLRLIETMPKPRLLLLMVLL